MASRKGVYVVCSSQGPETVHVEYGDGSIGISMNVIAYRQAGIQPPVEELPDVATYRAGTRLPSVKYDDWTRLKGKHLRVETRAESFSGVLEGLDDSVVAISPTEVAQPWRIRVGDKYFCVHPATPGTKVFLLPE